ncbi:MAG TPA: RIO1 family regulatory kinase/ATPase [Candidatus Acidoferrum sp.]|nr:RIO1 family regulatory kinase/ATPase [Candidatus Acidoferrum sp.]
MARMRSKRHRLEREDIVLKERRKTDQGIFDTGTMVYLSKFFNKRIITSLKTPIARGKEADIYLADAGDAEVLEGAKQVMMKFFRIEASAFIKMSKYIQGDPRFERQVGRSRESIINTWCKKEFGNLNVAKGAGVHAPTPYMFNGNIIAMEFLGDNESISPSLNDTQLERPGEVLEMIIEDMKRLYKSRLVHADISEYNILIHNGTPYMIDFGQAVSIKHPNANEFLKRDVINILNYFARKYKIKKERQEVYSYIVEKPK